MKYVYFLFCFFLFSTQMFAQVGNVALCYTPKARCTGAANCRACTNCNYCKYCNSGGSCGVCSSNAVRNYYQPKTYYPSNRSSNSNHTQDRNYLKTLIVNANKLNMRSGPSTRYNVVARLSYLDRLTYLGRTGNWIFVRTNKNQQGYVYVSYVLLQ